jgi:hypothetical protein
MGPIGLQDGAFRLSRNVGNKLPLLAALKTQMKAVLNHFAAGSLESPAVCNVACSARV